MQPRTLALKKLLDWRYRSPFHPSCVKSSVTTSIDLLSGGEQQRATTQEHERREFDAASAHAACRRP
jgi:hypothetical protein